MTLDWQPWAVAVAGVWVSLWVLRGVVRVLFGKTILRWLLDRGRVRLALKLRKHLEPPLLHD